MIKDFIPVEAKINGKYYIWYLDVSSLSLNELINLRNELIGSRADSIITLDAIIHDTINIDCQDLKGDRREKQRNSMYRNQRASVKNRHNGRR